MTYSEISVFTNSILCMSYSIIWYHDHLNKSKKYLEQISVAFTCSSLPSQKKNVFKPSKTKIL